MKLSSQQRSRILEQFLQKYRDRSNLKIISAHEYAKNVEVVIQGIDSAGRPFCTFTSVEK